jgi:hypothetical protein
MADQPTPEIEPDDTCRPVEVDGEIIRVRGAREMTDKERGYLAEVIQAAKRKYEAEHPEPPAPGGGPTVAEAAADDKRWPLEKTGE